MKKTVQTITLDKWVEERKIPKKVDFIKIDIEGTERLYILSQFFCFFHRYYCYFYRTKYNIIL